MREWESVTTLSSEISFVVAVVVANYAQTLGRLDLWPDERADGELRAVGESLNCLTAKHAQPVHLTLLGIATQSVCVSQYKF